jgi:hypothetical protein
MTPNITSTLHNMKSSMISSDHHQRYGLCRESPIKSRYIVCRLPKKATKDNVEWKAEKETHEA